MSSTAASTRHRRRPARSLVFVLAAALAMTVTPTLSAVAQEAAPPEVVLDAVDDFDAASTADGATVSAVTESPIPFTMVGFNHPDGIDVEVRTSLDGETWSAWYLAEAMTEEDGPDLDRPEGAAATRHDLVMTEPVWTGEARFLQLRVPAGAMEDVGATIIDSDGVSRSLFQRVRDSFRPGIAVSPAEANPAQPAIRTRAQWGADESWRKGTPSYASSVRYAILHHTAGGNDYTRSQADAVVRGIYRYHTAAKPQGQDWSDIGYNLLVDRFGTIYEGRAGGVDRGVVGAHAGGFNTGSFGVGVMGNHEGLTPSAATQEAVAQVTAWKFGLHGIAPKTAISVRSGGSNKYAAGTYVTLDTISGHRDVGNTACPGAAYVARMPWLRDRVAALVAAAQTAAPTAPAPTTSSRPFPDVREGTYYFEPVGWMVDREITTGYGKTGLFEPHFAVTRAELVTFLWRMMDRPTGYPAHGFPDVSSSSYYEQPVRWAKAEGITTGYGVTGRYEPHRSVTRGEMASFLWRVVNRPAPHKRHSFPDVRRTAHYDQPVSWMTDHGITTGYGKTGLYEPRLPVTRAETSAFMHRLASQQAAWRSAKKVPSTVLFR